MTKTPRRKGPRPKAGSPPAKQPPGPEATAAASGVPSAKSAAAPAAGRTGSVGGIPSRRALFSIFASIAALTWVGRYWLSSGFGLYEDDHYWTVVAMSMDAGDLWRHMVLVMETLHRNMARPILEFLMVFFSMIGYHSGGMRGLYFVGFLVLTGNSLLMYLLAWRLSGRRMFAITAALAFALFPADTTQAYLMHSFGLQPSLTFLLAALNLYASGRRGISYAVASACLLTYEVAYPVFFGAPLLVEPWGGGLLRRMARHSAVVGLIFGAVAGTRMAIGEGRVAGLDPASAAGHIAFNLFWGPWTSMKLWFLRPWDGLRSNAGEFPWLLLVLFLGVALFYDLATDRDAPAGEDAHPGNRPLIPLAGVLLLPLAYPLTLTVKATAVHGRGSRVHLAAALGASILVAWALTCLWDALAKRRLRPVAVLLVSTIFTANVAAGLSVQKDYRDAWQFQRAFWTDLIRLGADAGPNTVILVDTAEVRSTREALSLGWEIMGVIPQLFEMPSDWRLPPIAAELKRNWRGRLAKGDPPAEWINWKTMDEPYAEPYRHARYMLVYAKQGKLVRHEGPLTISGRTVEFLKAADPVLPDLPKRPLYQVLILRPEERPAAYLREP